MAGFRDRTWCEQYAECAHGATCPKALTPEVIAQAQEWWGGTAAPVSVFISAPGCFTPIDTVNKQT